MKRSLPDDDTTKTRCFQQQQKTCLHRQQVPQQQLSDPQTHSAAMHLGGRLSGRVVTRSKARTGDGFGSDTEHISAHLQQPAADATASKADLTRKPIPQVPGQISVPVVASARLSYASGTAASAAAPFAASTTKPRHQRSSSAGHAPKGFLQLQSDVASDLAYIADTLIKACDDSQPEDAAATQPPSGSAGALARRSTRLAAPAVDSAAAAPTSKVLSRASAPARQHKRLPFGNLVAHSSFPRQKASAAAAAAGASPVPAAPAAADSSAQPSASATSEDATPSAPGSAARRVRFAAGPLDPEHPNATDDGHPASEGALVVPVRRVPSTYAMDLSKGSVLMLQDLLGPECVMSVTRLKRRVGLLPPIRPPRPYANTSPGSSGA